MSVNNVSPTATSQKLSGDESRPHGPLVRRLLALGWRYRRACIALVLLQMTLVAITLSGLSLTGLGIDVLRHALTPTAAAPRWPFSWQPPSSWTPLATLTAISLAILALAMLAAALRYATALYAADITQRIVVRLRSEVYDRLQRLSFRFFDANESSSIINRVAGDVQAVRMFIDGVIVKVLTVALSLGVYIAYMGSVHWPLTLACLATSPLLWWGAVLFSRKVKPEYVKNSKLVDRMVLALAENVQGIAVVKGFAREQEQIEKFRATNRAIHDQKRTIFLKISLFQPAIGALTQLNMLVLLFYGGYLVVRGELRLGEGLFVFVNLLQEFANQVAQLTNIANTVQTCLTGSQRVFEVLDAPIEIASPVAPRSLPEMRGEIRFEHVDFSYHAGEPVLRDVSFDIQAGECVAIVGETGAGKSTLLSLIPRFYDVAAGSVSIDGIDVRDLDVDALRRQVGLVFQESFLFSNTVAANIAFGCPTATLEQIERAARLAAADEFIRALPQGYDTVIGEHGCNLSGGQRQRLAIARALLLNPPLLILDDATSAVDPETEHEIQRAVDGAVRGRTTLLVAHRMSSLRRADRILVLERGRLVQCGTHGDLARSRGLYERLARVQRDPQREAPLPWKESA